MQTARRWLRTLFFCCLLSLRFASAGEIVIEITDPAPSESYATADAEIRLSGTLTGADQVSRLEWFTGHGAHGRILMDERWLTDPIPLEPGGNWITVVATDHHGEATARSVYVFRDPPAAPAKPREFGSTLVDGREIRYEVIDGYAVAGDMILGTVEEVSAGPGKTGRRLASVAISAGRRWTNRTVVYLFGEELPEALRKRFLQAVDYWQARTPIRFVARTAEQDYVVIRYSSTTCGTGTYTMLLTDWCGVPGIVHEIGHTVGLNHEQSRSDRNRWIKVLYDNIDKPEVHNYEQNPVDYADAGPYDVSSSQQYGTNGFSRNGKDTMETRPRSLPVSQPDLSEADIRAVTLAYGVPLSETVVVTNPPGLEVEVDGRVLRTPARFNWAAGSKHTLIAPAIQGSGDIRHVFGRWSDDGPANHEVTAADGGYIYIANFVRQCRVTLGRETPAGSGTYHLSPYSPDGYYACRSEITLTARPASGYRLFSWSSTAFPATEQINFQVAAPRAISCQFTNQPVATVGSSIPGLPLLVDGRTVSTPQLYLWQPGSAHTIEGKDYAVANIRYRFQGWAHGGAAKQTVKVPAAGNPAEYTGKFATFHELVLEAVGSGGVSQSPNSSDGFHLSGSQVQVTADPFRTAFAGWGGDVSGRVPTQPVTMTDQMRVTGHFLENATPRVSGLSPNPVVAGSGPATIAVTGGNFYSITTIAVNGAPRPAHYVSYSAIQFALSAEETSSPGELRVWVANPGSPAANAVILRIAAPNAGCSYRVADNLVRATATGGAVSIPVSTSAGCPWFPAATAGWIDTIPAVEGGGPGYLFFEVLPNPSSKSRRGAIRVAGTNVEVEQEGLPCQVDLQPRSFTFPPAGGSASLVARLFVPDCDSKASADAGWVKIAPSATTQGGRVVQFTVDANPGDPRKATLRIAGVNVPITQATANPFIASVLNGGSLAASPLSPGARFALAGVNLAGATVAAPADRWPVSLGGVRVTLDGVDAPLGLVSPERIVGQVPWGVKVGDVPLILQVGDAPARAASVTVQEAAPGLFSAEAGKTLALNEDGTQNLRVNPAAAGSLITVFLTGQGPVDAAVEDGAGAPLDPAVKPVLPLAASIGGQAAEVTSAELAPGQVGVLRLGLRVPEVADGERPLTVTIGGAASNTGAIYVGQQNCVPKPEGLKSFWPADGTPEDVVGGLSATLQNGASYAPGFVGEAFSLDGIDDYVSVPDAGGLNPVAAVSVEAWIYRSAAVGLYDPVVKKASVRGGYTLEFIGDRIGFWAFTESKGWSPSALEPVPFGAWTHVVGVYDGSALRVYVDGRAAGAPVGVPGPLIPSSNPLNIGRDPSNPDRFFRGLIDEAGIYSRALSEAEIQVLYVGGARGKCRN